MTTVIDKETLKRHLYYGLVGFDECINKIILEKQKELNNLIDLKK
jgi:hypothetical protein